MSRSPELTTTDSRAERTTQLEVVCAELTRFEPPSNWTVVPDSDVLRRMTAEPAYALPPQLLNHLEAELPTWLSREEFALERQFSNLCGDRFLGVFLGQLIQFQPLQSQPLPTVSPEMFAFLDWEDISYASAQRGFRGLPELLDPVQERLAAYAGWLVTSADFHGELQSIRQRHGSTIREIGLLPNSPVRTMLTHCLEGNYQELHSVLADELQSFYDRWQISGLATWDLPTPIGPNLGGPAVASRLMGIADSPQVQVPPTIRLPVNYPLERVLRSNLPDTFAEWQQVQNQQHPDHMSYARFQRVLELHFLRNLVLRRGYAQRFRGHLEKLDRVFTGYFGDRDGDNIRKLRLWIDRRISTEA